MEIYNKLEKIKQHLEKLHLTFMEKNNYTDKHDYMLYKYNYCKFDKLTKKVLKYKKINSNIINLNFSDEIYHQVDRQMKLADIIEYIFFSRGIYIIFQNNTFKQERIKDYLELILRFVNLLMQYEVLTVDSKLRKKLLESLKEIIKDDIGFNKLKEWEEEVGLPSQDKNAPSEYFDSLLPKTAGGLWHEMLVFAFILKYDIGYIFPLLLIQKPISLTNKLSPPDLIILHKNTYRYYGIEIGNLKERQSGGFMAPSGIPVIPIDTLNARISDRCPICKKWIGICDKVIEDFCNLGNLKVQNEIRCLVDCNKYSLDDKINGKCPYMKFKYNGKIRGKNFSFADNKHHHYRCCINKGEDIINTIKSMEYYDDLKKINELLQKNNLTEDETEFINENYEKLKRKFNFLKTHSVYYSELIKLKEMNDG